MTVVAAFSEALGIVRETDSRITFLKERGFRYMGRHETISWRRVAEPNAAENAVMVELFLFHKFGGFSKG